MKIFNNIIKNYTDLHLHTKEISASRAASNEGHSFDEIIIQSDPREIEEHTFSKVLSQRLSSEVAKSTGSAEKIQDLKNQVTENTYTIDAREIASRILLI